jgi:hypothetical protein
MEHPFAGIEGCFEELPHPPVLERCDLKLLGIIIIALCGGDLRRGTTGRKGRPLGENEGSAIKAVPGLVSPSRDTFGRVLALLEAEAFQRCFARWVEAVYRISKRLAIAIAAKRTVSVIIRRLAKLPSNWLSPGQR